MFSIPSCAILAFIKLSSLSSTKNLTCIGRLRFLLSGIWIPLYSYGLFLIKTDQLLICSSVFAYKITHRSIIYSLIETAKENGLDPYRYLLWRLQNAPQLSETDEAWAEKLLPANAPEECYVLQK